MNKYIFYDESFSIEKESIEILGALSIPKIVYENEIMLKQFEIYDKVDKSFNDVCKYTYLMSDENNIKSIESINAINEYVKWSSDTLNLVGKFIKTNIFIINKTNDRHEIPNTIDSYLLYNKLPERVIYGLLKYGNTVYKSDVKILLDSQDQYHKYNVKEYLFNHLNALSVYRQFDYNVYSVDYVDRSKKIEKEIKYFYGVNFIDLVISLVRLVLLYNYHKQNKRVSLTLLRKSDVAYEILKKIDFKQLFGNSKVFECNTHDDLKEINIINDVNLFMFLKEEL